MHSRHKLALPHCMSRFDTLNFTTQPKLHTALKLKTQWARFQNSLDVVSMAIIGVSAGKWLSWNAEGCGFRTVQKICSDTQVGRFYRKYFTIVIFRGRRFSTATTVFCVRNNLIVDALWLSCKQLVRRPEWSGIQIATKNIASISQSVNRSVGRKATLETTLYDFVTARSDNRRQRHPGVYHKHTPDTRLSTLRYQYRTSQRLLRLWETPWNMSCLLYKAVTGRRVATVWMALAGEQDASSIIGHTSMHLVTATGRQSWVEHGWRTFGPVRRDETMTAWRWRGWRCRLWRVVVRRPSSSSSSSLFVSDDSSSNSPRRSDTTSPTLWLLHWCVEHNATK